METKTNKILIIAPHADDEILGCGGLIFKELARGSEVHILLVTKGYEAQGFTKASLDLKEDEIAKVVTSIPYASFKRLDLPAVALETIPRSTLIQSINEHINMLKVDALYLPFGGDVHTDHQIVSESGWAAAKLFRAPTVREVYAYEVLSETGFQTPETGLAFTPNTFIDITDTLEQKIAAFKMYASELQKFPFPRSEEAMLALAVYRGSLVNVEAAEAFVCLRMVK